MIAAEHPRQAERLASLADAAILDTAAEADFDALAQIAAAVCGTPIALVSFVAADRQWFKARLGVAEAETGLEASVCAHTILADVPLVIPDTTADPRTAGNPLLTNHVRMRFYAGVPIHSPDGLPLGALCVLDKRPRALDEGQIAALAALGRQADALLRLRRANRDLERHLDWRDVLIREIDHRVKNSLQQVRSLIRLQSARTGSAEAKTALADIGERIGAISRIHAALYRTDTPERVELCAILDDLAGDIGQGAPPGVTLTVESCLVLLGAARATAAALIATEFVSNAIKHAFPDGATGAIVVACTETEGRVRMRLSDTGRGFDPEAATDGLGRQIIEASVVQLGAERTWQSGPGGTVLTVDFAAEPAA